MEIDKRAGLPPLEIMDLVEEKVNLYKVRKEIKKLLKENKAKMPSETTIENKTEPEIGKYLVPKCEIHSPFDFCTEKESCELHPKLEEVYNDPRS